MMRLGGRIVFLLALLLVATTTTSNAQNTTGPCDLECYFNTTCVPGSADFSKHPKPDGQPLDIHTKTISPNGWRCDCPDGKTGLRCGRTYIGCQNKDHKCYNGGKCIPGASDRFGNTQDFCDCSDAIDKHGVQYVGKYCEIPTPGPCDDDEEVFCVNGGYCKEKWEEETHRPCRCGPEHDGQHCEYKKGEIPDCTLKCENGGHCNLGFKTYKQAMAEYQDFWEDNFNGTLMHCVCKEGFFGATCDVASTKCNNKHCFNGGTCTKTTKSDGTEQEHCDCSKAGSAEVSFSGQYCQYEATSFCVNDKVEGGFASFCVNGGKCKDNDAGLDCICPDGFSGPICEFADTETVACTLNCANNGICVKGPKDYSYMNEKGIDMSELSHIMNPLHTEDFESCKCPEGFTGLRCETKVEACDAEGQHLCLHGSTCVRDGDNISCDCNAKLAEDTIYAGVYCQHKATALCTLDGYPGTGKNKGAFCVNDGRCVKLVGPDESHAGCDCDAGLSGEHCEIRNAGGDQILTNRGSGSGGPKMSGVAIFFITFSAVLASSILVILYRRLRDEKEEIDFDDDDGGYRDNMEPPVLDMGPEKDMDGNELENVEII